MEIKEINIVRNCDKVTFYIVLEDDVNEIDINTFETKKINNLFLTGELLDVDGDCGGYNISFAILSGLIVSDKVRELC